MKLSGKLPDRVSYSATDNRPYCKFFDGQLEDGFQLEAQERFNSNIGDLRMAMTRLVY